MLLVVEEGGEIMNLDAMTTVISIIHCKDCPFYQWEEWLYRGECKLEEENGYPRQLPVIEHKAIGHGRIKTHPPIPPPWCPLRGSPVVVMVEESHDH